MNVLVLNSGSSTLKFQLVRTDAERLGQVAAALPPRTVFHVVAAELTERAECRRAVREAEAALGPIDVLVSCAGVLSRDFCEDVTEGDFERAYRAFVDKRRPEFEGD